MSIRAHKGILSIAAKMFIIHIFNSVQAFFCRGDCVNGDPQNPGVGVVRWLVICRRESDVSGYRSDHWSRVW